MFGGRGRYSRRQEIGSLAMEFGIQIYTYMWRSTKIYIAVEIRESLPSIDSNNSVESIL